MSHWAWWRSDGTARGDLIVKDMYLGRMAMTQGWAFRTEHAVYSRRLRAIVCSISTIIGGWISIIRRFCWLLKDSSVLWPKEQDWFSTHLFLPALKFCSPADGARQEGPLKGCGLTRIHHTLTQAFDHSIFQEEGSKSCEGNQEICTKGNEDIWCEARCQA